MGTNDKFYIISTFIKKISALKVFAKSIFGKNRKIFFTNFRWQKIYETSQHDKKDYNFTRIYFTKIFTAIHFNKF